MASEIPYVFPGRVWAPDDEAVAPIRVWEESDGRRRPTSEQQTDENGRLLWRVRAIHDYPQMRRAEMVEVTVASNHVPTVEYKAHLQFDQLTATPGKYEFRYRAEGISVTEGDIEDLLTGAMEDG